MIIIISVAVALAAMFSLSDSLLTILFSYICIVLSFGQINMFLSYPIQLGWGEVSNVGDLSWS